MSKDTNELETQICNICDGEIPATYEVTTDEEEVLYLCDEHNIHFDTHNKVISRTYIGQNKNQDVIDGLEKLIVFLKNNPELHPICPGYFYIFPPHDKQDYTIKQIKMFGSYRKKYIDNSFSAIKQFSDKISLELYTSRNDICKAEVVGKKVIKQKVMQEPTPEQKIIIDAAAKLTEELNTEIQVEVDDIQWICDPVIA